MKKPNQSITLCIFDLDNTLLAGDSDYLWGEFIIKSGLVAENQYREKNGQFYEDYKHGVLNMDEYLNFQLKILTKYPLSKLMSWRNRFIDEDIRPIMLKKATQLINKHRRKGHKILIMTATNRFITEPIAETFGISNLIATDPEFIDGKYTGNYINEPCFGQGKVNRLKKWLSEKNISPRQIFFYSDSRNDIPLLTYVTDPIAVDPDDTLLSLAISEKWPVMSLR